MTLLYDPRTKKPKPWVMIVVILLPIIIIVLGILIGKQKATQSPVDVESEADIFDRI